MNKLEKLKEYIKGLGSIAVAFSGGVDSTFLLSVAAEVLGDNAIAVTARSSTYPKREFDEAFTFAKSKNIRHFVCTSEELSIEGFSSNPVNRCYLCKTELFHKIIAIANDNDIAYVAEGSNDDDNFDYRPGLQAVKELGVLSPLREVGLTKNEIRQYSKEMGLPTWQKQSFACLSSRFPYGEQITEEKLTRVDKAEQLLLDMGFRQVRVRSHENLARIEVNEEELGKILSPENRAKIFEEFKKYGFTYVSVDIKGYRTGSMNETL